LVQYVYDAEQDGKLDRFGIKAARLLARASGRRHPFTLTHGKGLQDYTKRVEGRFPFPVESVRRARARRRRPHLGAMGVFTKRRRRAFSDQDASLSRWSPRTSPRPCASSTPARRANAASGLTSIGRLLSQVIHDFKTPMTVISGYVSFWPASTTGNSEEDTPARS